jgi:hypothetical protein
VSQPLFDIPFAVQHAFASSRIRVLTRVGKGSRRGRDRPATVERSLRA